MKIPDILGVFGLDLVMSNIYSYSKQSFDLLYDWSREDGNVVNGSMVFNRSEIFRKKEMYYLL